MRKLEPKSHRTGAPFGQAGFTLVELLVVITVIMLLATLLMPTVGVIIEQVYAGRSSVIIRRLHDGALLYKREEGFLPGEKKDAAYPGGSPRAAMNDMKITGSQVLAACLFNFEYSERNLDFSKDINKRKMDGRKVYATFDPEFLITYETNDNEVLRNLLSDGYPGQKAKPVCYFLSDPAYENKNRQFRFEDNYKILIDQDTDPRPSQTVLEDWVDRKKRTPFEVYQNGKFILVAAGLDRAYLVRTDIDPDAPAQSSSAGVIDDITNDYGGLTQ